METIRLAIVGAGALSTRRIYPNIGAAGAVLAAVCDLDEEKARANAERFGGAVYADLGKMLDEVKPDGVIICTGPAGHADLPPVALERRIPVYTEKPPAMSADAALRVARKAAETGVLCTTAFKKRYAACYDRARRWIDGIPPDDLLTLSIDYASAAYSNQSQAREFLFDFAIHAIDLVGYLFGGVDEVFAYTRDAHAYVVSLRFASGALGSMNLNDGRSFSIPTEEVEITARGGNFMTVHNSSSWRITQDGRPCEWREPPTFTSSGDSGRDTGHLAEIEDFVAAIREGRSTRSNIYESYKSMVLYEAIRESAERSTPIPVRYQAV